MVIQFVFTDSRGSFQLRTKEEVEKIKQEREEMDKKRNQTAWLGGSILDRNSPRNPNNPNAMITLPANYTLDTAPVRDTSTTNSAPASFDVQLYRLTVATHLGPQSMMKTIMKD